MKPPTSPQEIANLYAELIKSKDIQLDAMVVHKANTVLLYSLGFDKWFEKLSMISPALKEQVLDECLNIKDAANSIDWTNKVMNWMGV